MKRRNIIVLVIIIILIVVSLGGLAAYQFLWNTSDVIDNVETTQSDAETNTEDDNTDTQTNATDVSDSGSNEETSPSETTSITVTDMTAEIKAMFTEEFPEMLGGDSELLDKNIADVDTIESTGVEEYLDSGLNLAYIYALGGTDALFAGSELTNISINNVSAVTVTDSTKIFTVAYTATTHDEVMLDESEETVPDMNISVVATFVLNEDNKILSWTQEYIERTYVE